MSLLRGLFESRSLTPAQVFASDREDQFFYGTDAGVSVNQSNAVGLTGVFACTSLISETIGTLPLDAYFRSNGQRFPLRPRPDVLYSPVPGNPSITKVVHFSQLTLSILFDGNSFTLCLPSVYDAVSIHVLDPRSVEVKGSEGNPIYRVRTSSFGSQEYGPDQMIHIPRMKRPGELRGISPVEQERQALGAAIASERFAATYFKNGATSAVVLEVPGNMPDEDAKQITRQFDERHTGQNAHKTGILTGGAHATQLSVTPEQAQFLETRKNDVIEQARIFRVPPVLIGVNDPGAVSYASVDAAVVSFEKHTIRPLLELIEPAYSRLLPRPESFVKFNTDGLLRGDPKTRWETNAIRLENGMTTINRILSQEDEPPFTGDLAAAADMPRVKGTQIPINSPEPQVIPNPIDTVRRDNSDEEAVTGLRAAIRSLAEPAQITVEAPNVTVAAAKAPDVIVHTDSFVEAIAELKRMLEQPVTRQVERDASGRPIRVVETRG
jgi:HK97 family phage portal protein